MSDESCEIDKKAIRDVCISNAIDELNDFAFNLTSKIKERITSTGMPIGDKITTQSFFEFNTKIILKYENNQ